MLARVRAIWPPCWPGGTHRSSHHASRRLEWLSSPLLGHLPVYLAPATTESKGIRFNQLNAVTGNRLRQQLIDAETGEIVERDRVAKGHEYSRGQYVMVEDDELKAPQIESARRSST